jgi:inorganic pyrophosphatase
MRTIDAREWRRWEQLINERGIVIDRPGGHAHPLYPDMIYPCDYGHVPDTSAPDGEDVDVFVGPVAAGLVGLIALTHQPSRVSEPKLLMNLSRADADKIVEFLDRGDPRPDLRLFWRESYASALGSGGVSRIEPDSPPGVGRRGSRTPADPNPCGKSPQPKLAARRVRQTLQR